MRPADQPTLCADAALCRGRRGVVRRQRGFTLIELIMVIIMLGVLAVFAAPRMFDSSDFYARGFHDETLALLRYAQKAAIAQRRTVCVTFSTTAPASATLSIASAAALNACSISLIGPNKNTESNKNCAGGPAETGQPIQPRGCILAKAGVAYSTPLADFGFNGLGQPINTTATGSTPGTVLTSAKSVQVTGASAITVEPETGYVHD